MSKFIVADDFWELFPSAAFGVVLVKGIDNSQKSPVEIQTMLKQANQETGKFFGAEVFSQNPNIAIWRKAYQQFKTKKGVHSSIENLLKRVSKGQPVGSINPLVDIYNIVSLRYGLPIGGEDLDTFIGDLRLTRAKGGEDFLPIGGEKNDPALPGEVVYKDDAGIICRAWNWRDGQRTMLTENSQNIFLVIDTADESQLSALKSATDQLKTLIDQYFMTDSDMAILSRQMPNINL